VFVVNTGILTTCCAMAALVSLVVSPKSLIYAAFYFCIGRFYTNSFLATLNARQSLKGPVDDTSCMMMSLPTNGLSHTSSGMSEPKKQQNIAIRIDTSREGMEYEAAEKTDERIDNKNLTSL
jgi:hypothetical protein